MSMYAHLNRGRHAFVHALQGAASLQPRRTSWCLVGLLACVAGCIVGQRGVVEFSAEYPLSEIQALRVDLPDTPLSVRGDPLGETLNLDGYWFSVGGSATVAQEHAEVPELVYDRDGAFAQLSALVPVELRQLIDLEVGEITVPEALDIELLTGLGNVEVTHVIGNVSVDVEAGHITVAGGDEGVAARTRYGDVEIRSPGAVEATTSAGYVRVTQTGVGGNSIFAESNDGDVRIEILSDANLNLDLYATGDIRVQTSTVSTVSSGEFHREVGNGSVDIHALAVGHVTVVLLEPE